VSVNRTIKGKHRGGFEDQEFCRERLLDSNSDTSAVQGLKGGD